MFVFSEVFHHLGLRGRKGFALVSKENSQDRVISHGPLLDFLAIDDTSYWDQSFFRAVVRDEQMYLSLGGCSEISIDQAKKSP